MSRRDVPALRRMRPERTWKDEVQERVQRRRSERAAGAEPLPLFPDPPETLDVVAVADPPVAAHRGRSEAGTDDGARVDPASWTATEAPSRTRAQTERANSSRGEGGVGDVDLRGSRIAPPAPGSPLDLELRSVDPPEFEVEAQDESDSRRRLPDDSPDTPAHVMMLDDPPAESVAPAAGPRLDWPAAADDAWPGDADEPPAELPVVERPANPEERLNAGLLDLAVIVSFWCAAVYLASRAAQVDAAGLVSAWPGLLVFLALLGLVYAGWFTGSTGQTPGKMLVGIRVVDRSGAPLGVGRALLRAILGALGTVALGTGLAPMFFDPARRALHDRLLRARVVRG